MPFTRIACSVKTLVVHHDHQGTSHPCAAGCGRKYGVCWEGGGYDALAALSKGSPEFLCGHCQHARHQADVTPLRAEP